MKYTVALLRQNENGNQTQFMANHYSLCRNTAYTRVVYVEVKVDLKVLHFFFLKVYILLVDQTLKSVWGRDGISCRQQRVGLVYSKLTRTCVFLCMTKCQSLGVKIYRTILYDCCAKLCLYIFCCSCSLSFLSGFPQALEIMDNLENH